MKKTIKYVIAIMLAFACVISLVSCLQPKTNLEKAKANLEAAGYKVTYNTDPNTVGVTEILTATSSSGNIFEDIGDMFSGDTDVIVITKYDTTKGAKLAAQEAKLEVEQQIEAKKLDLKIAKYEASKYDADNAKLIAELEEDIEDLKERLECIGRSGKYVWIGTEDAIKATK